jgi:hypothetical protein
VLAALSAAYLAYVTNETLLAPVIETFKAGLALATIYGLAITTEQTGMAIAVITAIFAAFQRTQVSPLNNPTFKYIEPADTATPGAGEGPVAANR